MLFRTCVISCLTVFLFVGIAWTASALVAQTAEEPPSDQRIAATIAAEQERVLSHLESRLMRDHEALSEKNSQLKEESLRRNLTGGRDFWNDTFREVYWQNAIADGQDTRGFSRVAYLRPPESVVPKSSVDSRTMAATTLLNHVFDNLDELGYQSRSTPSGIIAGIQYASNTWTLERKSGTRVDRITVTGEVFLAPRDQRAVIKGAIHYRIGQ